MHADDGASAGDLIQVEDSYRTPRPLDIQPACGRSLSAKDLLGFLPASFHGPV
jgi:hypothetical protein